jgi:4-diphosphocytidyl-2-C-methyl-D-erythritol kinase
MTRVALAPAKINLGLEILGRRGDGYHEVRTILCAISLADRLAFEPAPGSGDELVLRGTPVDGRPENNLVLRALRAMRDQGATIPPQHVIIDKLIPTAAGLGGASSDAAATLRAFASELADAGADPVAIAASLGSDVPFFLGGPVALASGRGETLTALPAPAGVWVVLVTPDLAIPDKTRTMYGAVDPAWWSEGSEVGRIAASLPRLPTAAPFNVFTRVLLTRFPETATVRDRLLAAGAPFAALTGAGPTFYTLVDNRADAQAIATGVDVAGATVLTARLGSSGDA